MYLHRVCFEGKRLSSGFKVLVTSLSLSDLLMGVYLIILGVADHRLLGDYLLFRCSELRLPLQIQA